MVLKVIDEPRALNEVKKVFEEIKDVLVVSDVGILFKALAVEPNLLEVVWSALKPNAGSFAFAKNVDLLKQESLEGMGKIYRPYDYLPQILDVTLPRSEILSIDNQLTFYLYLTTRQLILNTALERLTEGEVIGGKDPERESFEGESPFRETLTDLVSPERSPQIRETYRDITESLKVEILDEPYRSLANWPDYLLVAWADLKPFAETGDYRKEEERIYFIASNLAKDLPFEISLEKKDLEKVGRIVSPLRRVFLTSLLNTTAFKVALDRAVI